MKKKILSRFKNCQGFTMIEMILTVALTAIFFTVVALVLPQWIKSYQSFIRVSYANQIADNIIEAVKEQITYSSNVSTEDTPGQLTYNYLEKIYNEGIVGESPQARSISLGGAGGVLIPGFVYDPKYYMDNNVTLLAQVEDIKGDYPGRICNLDITIEDKTTGNTILTKTRSIRLYGAVGTS